MQGRILSVTRGCHSMRFNPTLVLSSSALALTVGLATPAFAQDAQEQPAEQTAQPAQATAEEAPRTDTRDTIVVTGTRIARPNVESAVPLAVVGQAELLQDAQQNISDTLNELPQVAVGLTRTNSNFLTSGNGIATVNLRSLGSSRTLTLVNGRRFIGGFAGDSAVDLNNIPSDFVDRIEIVTGGSSAVYGSDAVAGVVNFILKDEYDGIGIRAQSGITDEGDNPRYLVSVTAGQKLFDDRLSLIGNFTWDKDEGLPSRNRGISDQDCGANAVCGPTGYSSFAPQGRFQLINDELDPIAILPGGTSLFTFNPDNSLVFGFPTGFGFNRNSLRLISTPLERKLATGLLNFEVTDAVKFFAEATYSKVDSNSTIEPLAIDSIGDLGNAYTIDNPFIPQDIQDAIAAANSDADPDNDVDFISFRRRSNDIFDRSNTNERKTFRLATGFNGKLAEKYDWEVSYVYGRMHDFTATTDIDISKYNDALDAIRVGPGDVVGVDIICADPAAVAAGCIPVDLFGHNTVDPRAAEYIKASVPRSDDILNKQHVVTASISGPLFSLWAGDVNAAVGGEYRKETTREDLDELTNAGLNSGNQLPDLSGKFHVWEAFGEIQVPLIQDASFTKFLGLTGAARYSDYSTIGGVWSYNIGAEWAPIDDVRFRGMYAVANRAPNVGELFSQPSQTFAAISDPCDGVTATADQGGFGDFCRAIPGVAAAIADAGVFEYTLADLQGIDGFIGGNQNLQEETAKTKTLGVVLTPRFLPGFSATIDYYDIKIKDAIATLGRNFSVEQCLLTGNSVFCDNVIRNPNTGFITRVNGQLINVAGFQSKGVDVGVNYNRRLGLVADDRLSLSINYTYLIDNKTQSDPATPPVDSAGTFGRGFSRHSALLRGSYKVGVFTFGWTSNYLSGHDFLKDFFSANEDVMALNKIDDYWLHDLQIRFDPAKKFSLYFNVDNVFDTKPQLLPGASFGTPTGLETSPDFDVFGRRFSAGVRFGF